MAQKPTAGNKSKLMSWFFKAPVKFALLSLGLMVGLVLIYALITRIAAGPGADLSHWAAATLMAAAMIFSIRKYIGWLPKENLDRKSFVAVSNGLAFVYCAVVVLFAVFVASRALELMMYAMWMPYHSVSTLLLWFLLPGVAVLVAGLYIIGLFIAGLCATYRRALTMGVSRFKALLAMPFAAIMFWFPGYLLADDSKAKPAVAIHAKWYSKLTDWVVAKPLNAFLAFLVMIAITALCSNIYAALFELFFGAIFAVWLLIAGTKKFQKNIGGMYSTVAGALNIAIILLCVGLFAMFSQRAQNNADYMSPDGIQLVDANGGAVSLEIEETEANE
ncbi:MAG: hypothetical protein LBJ73_01210 [Rickettsiales bacterium]|jgi:hypothetical protein|nr:hypothetical protein [Rickettsiales bacterium]